MALARIVWFEGVTADRIAEMRRELSQGERPQEIPAEEIMVLHDMDAERSLVVLVFDTEEDYRRGDELLNAMPVEETPGRRTSVARYEVAIRVSG
jgi:hypothetical protein